MMIKATLYAAAHNPLEWITGLNTLLLDNQRRYWTPLPRRHVYHLMQSFQYTGYSIDLSSLYHALSVCRAYPAQRPGLQRRCITKNSTLVRNTFETSSEQSTAMFQDYRCHCNDYCLLSATTRNYLCLYIV